MTAADTIRSLSGQRLRRSEEPIVGRIRYDGKTGSWENAHWTFDVPYAFRDALDIRFDPRRKSGQTVMVWTQGGCLAFAEGDVLSSRDGRLLLRVTYAVPMGWDTAVDSMYEGAAAFDVFEHTGNGYRKLEGLSGSQMDFLELLISGTFKGKPLHHLDAGS